MKDNGLEERLRTVIAEAVKTMPKASALELAHWTRKHHRPLIKEFQDEWIDEKLASLFSAEIRLQRPMKRGRPGLGHPQQERLPGWEDIPYKITVERGMDSRHGKQVMLANATLEDLRNRKALVQDNIAAFATELPQLNQLIALMERYDKEQPGITVAAALELQAATRKKPGRVSRRASSKLG